MRKLGWMMVVALVWASSWPAAAEDQAAALEAVFGPVTVTETTGGPPHDGQTPAELGLFAGTRNGDGAVYYRLDNTTGVKDTWRWEGRTQVWELIDSEPQPSDDPDRPGDAYGGTAGTMPDWASGQMFLYSGGYNFFENAEKSPPQDPVYQASMHILGDDGRWSPAPCSPDCAPGPLDGGASASGGGDTLLFGGQTVGGPDDGRLHNTVWRWNGADWDELVVQGTPPSVRAAAGFAFDGRDFILFGGGTNVFPPTSYGDTWRLSSDSEGTWRWELVCDVCPAPRRHQTYTGGLYSHDGTTRGVLMVGGVQFASAFPYAPSTLSDRWAWDGSQWRELAAGDAPCPNEQGPVACLADPTIPFVPYVAALPALDAVVWTAGFCTSYDSAGTQTCQRRTTQLSLDAQTDASTTTSTPTTTPDDTAGPPVPASPPADPSLVAPRFTG